MSTWLPAYLYLPGLCSFPTAICHVLVEYSNLELIPPDPWLLALSLSSRTFLTSLILALRLILENSAPPKLQSSELVSKIPHFFLEKSSGEQSRDAVDVEGQRKEKRI